MQVSTILRVFKWWQLPSGLWFRSCSGLELCALIEYVTTG